MAMAGLVKNGAALLATWTDPYTAIDIRSRMVEGRQTLDTSAVLRKSARGSRLRVLGKGDYVTIAKAYREVARERGYLVTWDQKLAGHPERAGYFGASNVKLLSVLQRRMNEESTTEESVRVNWTFDEAAQLAEHLKRDLKLDKVLFGLGGWIHRGYDNQHPDVLPAAPELGGNEGLADCARRVEGAGYLLALHDNYQDIYRDSPSWDEKWIEKKADGSLVQGGRWAGGRAFITCSRQALELARRPRNLTAVQGLTHAHSYFIDTTYAAGLDPALFVRGDNGWTEALHPADRFLKNTHEVLSPLNELTAQVPMMSHEFLDTARQVCHTVFGEGAGRVDVVVNIGGAPVRWRSKLGGEVELPAHGFVVEGQQFAAFHVCNWNGQSYARPPLFTLRSLDGHSLATSRRVRVFHGYGDSTLRFGGVSRKVLRDEVLTR